MVNNAFRSSLNDAEHALLLSMSFVCRKQRWSRGHKARGQGQGNKKNPRPRPMTQKKSEAKAKDSLSEDRHSRGQGQECSRPRTKNTAASVLQKKKKKKKERSSQKFFKRSPQKNVFQKIFQALHKILTIQIILLSSSRGQANFRGLEASRPRTWSSRPRPRTSKCVLEDSTSGRKLLLHQFLNSKH